MPAIDKDANACIGRKGPVCAPAAGVSVAQEFGAGSPEADVHGGRLVAYSVENSDDSLEDPFSGGTQPFVEAAIVDPGSI
jgi:hypothetical protein